MASTESPAESILEHLLVALNPLLTERDSSAVSRITATIRTAAPPAPLLVNTLYVFSKLVLATPGAATSFCNLVNALVSCGVLSLAELFNASDVETQRLLQPDFDHEQDFRRANTRLFYTQTRFNLFREESEGYAKLITLLWDAVSAPPDAAGDIFVNALLGLIGQFDLDANRVIELVLSAAADAINDQKLRSGPVPTDQRLPALFGKLLDEFPAEHVYSVVGAMLQSYHSSPGPGVADKASKNALVQSLTPPSDAASTPTHTPGDVELKTPPGFLTLIVVLIRERRMTVSDIWHNFSPRDDEELVKAFLHYEGQMQKLSAHVCSSKVGTPTSGSNQGIMARTGIGPSERDIFLQYKFILAGPFAQFSCQKLDLIFLLINMCRWDDALEAILGLGADGEQIDVAAHPGISGALISFVDILLNPLLSREFPERYPHNSHITDAIAELGGRANRCPCPITTIDELLSASEDGPGIAIRQMLNVLGPHTRSRPGLLHALCRLVKGRKEPAAVEIMQNVVLPAFSLLQSNVGLAHEIWEVLRLWSHTVRWQLYGNLHFDVQNTCAVYNVVAERAAYEMKYVLKRLTTETLKSHVPTITKITHGQALPVFSTAVDRIQGYPPDAVTISPVVEACRDCTDLSVDMLLFVIVDRMSNSKRSRLKEDGINIAQWYATLSLFLGLCMRKLRVSAQQIEGVLSFLYTKLVLDEEALLITALSDVIMCVADIEVESNLTVKQIQAQGGGDNLRAAVSGIWGRLQPDPKMVGHAIDTKLEREKRRATLALQGAFERTKAHVYVAIAIAQLTRSAVFQEDLRTMPLKLGANIVDRAKSSLSQLSQFLDAVPLSDSKAEELRQSLWHPLRHLGMEHLTSRLKVPVPSAMALLSPTLDYVAQEQLQLQKDKQVMEAADKPTDGNLAKLAPSRGGTEDTAGEGPTSDSVKPDKNINKDAASTTDATVTNGRKSGDQTAATGAAKGSSFGFAHSMFSRTEGYVSTSFLNAFWTLKLSDISVPVDLYESERQQLSTLKDTWEKEVERHRRGAHGESDRWRRGETEARAIRNLMEALTKEERESLQRQDLVLKALRKECENLCATRKCTTAVEQEKAVSYVLQECVLPRCKLSSCDAIFCSKFVLLLLQFDAPIFSYSKYFAALLRLVPLVLSSCSENEALSIARLAKEVLVTLERWRSNRKVFDAEAGSLKKNGFYTVDDSFCKIPMRHEQYCQWLFDIHELLAGGLCATLMSDEYLNARNSICVLAGIADVFPKVSEHSSQIEECVGKLCESDLQDIRLSSSGALARLKGGKAKRLPKHIFKLKPVSGQTPALANGKGLISNMRPPKLSLTKKAGDEAKHSSAGSQGKGKPLLTPTAKVALPHAGTATKSVRENGHPATNTAGGASGLKEVKAEIEVQKQSLNPAAKVFKPRHHPSETRVEDRRAQTDVVTRNRTEAAVPLVTNGKDLERSSAATERRSTDEMPSTKRLKTSDLRQSHEEPRSAKNTNNLSVGKDTEKQDEQSGALTGKTLSSQKLSTRQVPEAEAKSEPSTKVAPVEPRTHSAPNSVGQDRVAENLPKREEAARDPLPRDTLSADKSSRTARQGSNWEVNPREGTVRNGTARAGRDGGGRDTHTKTSGARNTRRRDSPMRAPSRQAPDRDVPARELSGGGGKEITRRRRTSEHDIGRQYGTAADSGQIGHPVLDYDEGVGNPVSLKRKWDVSASRDSQGYDGDGRRSVRQRQNEIPVRDRIAPRDGPPRDRRFESPPSPEREVIRFDSTFSGRRSPPLPSGPHERWRPQGHDSLPDARHPGNGVGSGGPRRRGIDADRSPGWNHRSGDRPDFDGRERSSGRPRDDARNEGDYGAYDDRGGNRGGSRPYRDRRNGGRDDRGPRDNFRRRNQPRNGGGGGRR